MDLSTDDHVDAPTQSEPDGTMPRVRTATTTTTTTTAPRIRPVVAALAAAIGTAAAVGLAWPEISDAVHADGVSRPDRIVHLVGCLLLTVAAALFVDAALHETGRRRAGLAGIAAGAAILTAATVDMTTAGAPVVGLIPASGPTGAQIVGIAVLVAAVCTMPSCTRWTPVVAIDVGLVTITAVSLTWLAPVRTSKGPGGGLADVVTSVPAALVLVALMVSGVVLLVRALGEPRPGDIALAVAVLLIPSALYVSILGRFAGHGVIALRTATLWWMTGPLVLLIAGAQARRGAQTGNGRRSDHRPEADDLSDAGDRRAEGVATAATLLTLGAVATHRLFIESLDPVMLALGLVTLVLSTSRLALLQRRQSLLQERLGDLATTFHARARTDELTGLGNRVALSETLHRLLAEGGTPVDVFYGDLDEFKAVNDALGHETGDALLVGTARRLESILGTAVHRVGGDEFVAVRNDLDEAAAAALARRVVEVSTTPLDLDGLLVPARMSLGTARVEPAADGHGRSRDDEVLGMADLALNRAKELGRGRAVVYDRWLSDRAERRITEQRGLRDAIDRDDHEVSYRPVVDLSCGAVLAAEATVRWRTPEGRLLPAAELFDVAASSGLVPALSRSGLTNAAGPWTGDDPPTLMLVVTASRQELVHVGFVEMLEEVTDGIGPERFRLAISESVLMDRSTEPNVDRLAARGVRICVREFGTAASSVRRLERLPGASIRIDRSFVAGLDRDGVDTTILEVLVRLGSDLGITIVADGVTRQTHVERLLGLGVTVAQGHLFGRPSRWPEFEARHVQPEGAQHALRWRPTGDRSVTVGTPGDRR